MKLPRRLLAVVASLVFCLVLTLLLDGAFRLYERFFLVQDVARLEGPFDLRALGYHHHGPPVARQKPPGVFRVLSIGDSFAYAITTPPHTYAARLERLLAGDNASAAEVVNLGAPGVSFPEYLAQARFWEDRLEHDAVVFNIYAGNDFLNVEGTMVHDAGPLELLAGPGARVPRKHGLRFLDYVEAVLKSREMRRGDAGDARLYDPGLAGDLPADRYPRIMRDSALVYRADKLPTFQTSPQWCFELLQHAARLQRAGKTVVVLVSPPHLVYDEHWRAVAMEGAEQGRLDPFLPGVLARRLADEAGLSPDSVVDLHPCFQEAAANGTTLYHGLNTHWTVEGNELAAQALFRAMRPELPAPPGACSLSPRRDVADETLMAPVLENIRQAETLETNLLTPMAGKGYASPQAVEAALRAAGYTPNPAIRGLVDSILFGERGAVWVEGWALRLDRPRQRYSLLAFHDDRLVGAGLTLLPRQDVGARHGLSVEASAALGFHFQAALPPDLRPGDDLMVVAVDEEGGFAFLDSREFSPRAVRAGE